MGRSSLSAGGESRSLPGRAWEQCPSPPWGPPSPSGSLRPGRGEPLGGQACIHGVGGVPRPRPRWGVPTAASTGFPHPRVESKAAEKPRGLFPWWVLRDPQARGPVWQQIQIIGTTGRQATGPPWPEGPWVLHMPGRAEGPASGRWAPSPRSCPVPPPPGSPCPLPGSLPPVCRLVPLC